MKLQGIKVVDLTLFLPGPQMTATLADHGADVIKVEPKGGDPARHMPPFENGQSVWFRTMNRGKKSMVLDLKSDAGLQRLHDLVRQADIFVEGFRPGVVERLRIDYDTLSAINPRLVYCSISAFGQDGPLAHHPAHDLAVESYAGFISVNDGPNGTPVVPAVPAADMAASLTALSAVLMALIGRDNSGRGDYIDIAMYDSLLPWCGHVAGPAITDGTVIRSREQRSLGGAAFYNVYETADGRHVVLGGREEKFVRNLLNALDRPDLIEICLGEAGPGQQPAIDFLRTTFRTRSQADWREWFAGKDVCFAPVLTFPEALDHAQIASRDMLLAGPQGQHVFGSPFKFANEPAQVALDAPDLDDHRDDGFAA